MRAWIAGAALVALAACQPAATPPPAAPANVADFSSLKAEPKTIAQILDDIASGKTTSAKITQAYLDRIARVDDAGPMLNAVIATNPNALANAQATDGLRAGGVNRLLMGVPILVKDNIETLDPMPTTAGSLALKDNLAGRDAPMIKRLRDAGAVILGKTNLSEWANWRSDFSTSGWSAVGGLTKNPFALDRNACGSSSGSGAAVAAGLAAAAIGTETDGSVSCPAAVNGLVGIKPTVGLVSRTHLVPISPSQDTAGPMALTVADAAMLLTVMAGTDPDDPATKDADAKKADYAKALDSAALKGKRIGVLRFLTGYSPGTDAAFENAMKVLTSEGATLVDIKAFDKRDEMGKAEGVVLHAEFKDLIGKYLLSTPGDKVKVRTLDDLIAFNTAEPGEMAWFGQNIFEDSLKAVALTDKKYLNAKAAAKKLAGPEGIDAMLAKDKLDALVAPTGGPAWVTDLVTGDHFGGSASSLPAVAGYPYITVPMGDVHGLPVGLSFIGAAWSEAKLIGFAYDYEQKSHARITPAFKAHIP